MNFVGKVLIVTQLVLSIVFMAFAGAVYTMQTNWKDKYTLKDDEKKLVSENLDATRKKFEKYQTDMDAELETIKGELNTAKADLTNEQQETQNLKILLADERTKSADSGALASVLGREAEERLREANIQRVANKELVTSLNTRFSEIQRLENEIFELKKQTKKIGKKHQSLLDRVVNYKRILLDAGLHVDPDTYVAPGTPPPPKVEGFVLNSKTSKNKGTRFIEISLGSDDGIAEDHILFVTRKSKYLGKIKIVHITPDRAVGTVVQDAKNGTIQRGDHVTAKLL